MVELDRGAARPLTVPALLSARRREHAERVCVATPTDRLTYLDLDERSAALAADLAAIGVGKGTRVGLLFPNGVEWVLAWAAVTRIGAIAVPVNTFYRAPELAVFLRHADVQVLIGVRSFVQHDYVARLEEIAPELRSAGSRPLLLPTLPQLRRVLLRGTSLPAWADAWPGCRDDSGRPEMAAVVASMGDDVTPADVLLVTYTSGSTGEPKGVVHGHGAVLRHADNLASLAGLDPTSRIWTPMPLCWVGGFVFGMVRAFVSGGCFLTQAVFEAGETLRFLEREAVTDIAAWPAVTRRLVDHPQFGQTDLSTLRSGLYEALSPEDRPPDPVLAIGSLGMSETAGPHTFRTRAEDRVGVPPEYRGTFGHPVPGVQHRITDPDTGVELGPGEEGEVLVRGDSLMLGLYKRERRDTFDVDGWYHTDDRGYFRDGWFFFTGRQSDLIKSAGSNVAPAEVEQELMAFDEVRLAFVLGVPDEVRGQRIVALVVLAEGSGDGATGEALRAELRDRLSSYKVPEQVLVIGDADVPWLVSQKADRRALQALAERLAVPHPRAD